MIIDLNLAKVSVGSEVPISEEDDQNIVSELSKINSFPDFLLPVSKSSNYSSDLCLLILDHDMPNNDLIAPIGDRHDDINLDKKWFLILFSSDYEDNLILPRIGEHCTVPGWKNSHSTLREFRATIVEDVICNDMFTYYNVTKNTGCAQGEVCNVITYFQQNKYRILKSLKFFKKNYECFEDQSTPIICDGKISGLVIDCHKDVIAFTR